LADRLFQTAAEVCRKDRSAKAEWARFIYHQQVLV